MELSTLLDQSDATFAERNDIITTIVSIADNSFLNDLIELCSEDQNFINVFLTNYREKRIALSSGNKEAWKRVLEKEQGMLATQ